MKYILIGLFVTAIAFASCKNNTTEVAKTTDKITTINANTLADSLVYGIVTHASENIDPYENDRFKSFLQDKLISSIFEKLYEGRLKAYDFFSDKELSIKEIREIEKAKGFNRSKVGKVQFNEQWYFDKSGVLNKRVNSMTLGIESYSNQGSFTGYNALFTVKF
ncbi:MAG: hypothetical protein HXX16_15470 [Bacteroidales bacterium]|nr:hypothetical protein [Bacteroidales bacterium]